MAVSDIALVPMLKMVSTAVMTVVVTCVLTKQLDLSIGS